jgi:hypothetical protein
MVSSMTSAQRKLLRGIEQVKALSAETSAFENANAYVLRTEREHRTSQEIEYVSFAVERQAPPDHWPLLAGEAIHNLRCSLEHAVYTASGGAKGTQFPIFVKEAEFQKSGRPMIARTSTAVRALIEARQPYNRTSQDPSFDPLARLQKLSNLDKHRTLAVVACAIDLAYVGHDEKGGFGRFTYVGQDDQPLHEGTKVLAYIAPLGAEGKQVNVNPGLAYQVRIEGLPLASALTAIARRAFECLVECETAQPMPVMAMYPI